MSMKKFSLLKETETTASDSTVLKEAIAAEQDFTVDLMEFKVEGQINNYFAGKGFPQRCKLHWASKHVLEVQMRGFVLAVFTPETERLYKCSSSPLHWALITAAFKTMYPNVKTYD